MTTPVRYFFAAVFPLGVMLQCAPAATMPSGSVCTGHYATNAAPTSSPEKNRGTFLVLFDGVRGAIYLKRGTDGYSTSLPPFSLDEWERQGEVPMAPTPSGYSFIFESKSLGWTVEGTLEQKPGSVQWGLTLHPQGKGYARGDVSCSAGALYTQLLIK